METLKELVEFMKDTRRLDVKVLALSHVLGLTGSTEGKSAILEYDDMLMALFGITYDSTQTIAKDAVLALINLTAEDADAVKIYETAKRLHPIFPIVDDAVKHILDENSELADPWTMVLSNLTRSERLVNDILSELKKDNNLLKLAKAFAKLDYNKKNGKLNYLAPIFCNLTQVPTGREHFIHSEHKLLDKVLPFAAYESSILRRGGTVGILKNICFDPRYHDFILKDREDILQTILYPLCGPEEYSDEDNEKFFIELQYLPETKTREEDPDLRKMLLESLLQLCAIKANRELLRSKGVYEILREYHTWEAKVGKDKDCLLACENVVDILIKKEEEIGLDNYRDVNVPAEYAEKFAEEDEAYLKDLL